jgi:hypothetical protein
MLQEVYIPVKTAIDYDSNPPPITIQTRLLKCSKAANQNDRIFGMFIDCSRPDTDYRHNNP